VFRIITFCFLLLAGKNAISQHDLSGDGFSATCFVSEPEIKAVIWKYNGQLTYLDKQLEPVREITLVGSNIVEVTAYSEGLLVIVEPEDREKSDIISQVIDIDPHGKTQNTWSTNSFLFWSTAYDDGERIATNSTGALLRLESESKQVNIGQYPGASIVLSTPNSDRLICTLPNLTKAHYASAFCQGADWSEKGEWRDILRPFICKGYLIEPSGGWRNAPVSQLLIRSIKTGEVLNKKSVTRMDSVNCADDKLIYTNEMINVLSLPGLENLKQSQCGDTAPISATLVNGDIVCLDQDGKLHTE
jgi:hypothetical protein